MRRSTRLLILLSVLFATFGCGGGGEKQEKKTAATPPSPSPATTTPQQATKGPQGGEKVEGLDVGESAVLGNGTLTVTADEAYKATPRQGDFTPSKGGPNWAFFRDLQKTGEPALLLAVTVAAEAGTNADPRFDTTSFTVNDENGYTLPQLVSPPELDPQHPNRGWQGTVQPGQTRGATIARRVPPNQDAGLLITYQFSGDPRTPRATWAIGNLDQLPEAPIS